MSAVSTLVNRGLPLKAYVFRNYNFLPGVRSHYLGGCQHKMWQAIRASSAAPGYFQECVLGNDLHQVNHTKSGLHHLLHSICSCHQLILVLSSCSWVLWLLTLSSVRHLALLKIITNPFRLLSRRRRKSKLCTYSTCTLTISCAVSSGVHIQTH